MNTALPQNNTVTTSGWAVLFFLSLLSSVLLILPALFSSLWFLTFFSLIPLFFLIKATRNPFLGTVIATFIGTTYFLVVFYPLSTLNTWWWTVSQGFLWEHKQFVYFSVCVVLAVFCSALTFAPIFFIYSKWLRNRPRLAPVSVFLLSASWVLGEIIRVKILFGLEWALLGQPLGNNLLVARSGTYGGIFTLSFLVVTVNVCVFQLIECLLRKNNEEKIEKVHIFWKMWGILLMVAAAILFNNQILEQKSRTQGEFRKNTEQIALISPDMNTSALAQTEGMEKVYQHIEENFKNTSKNIIILPENVFPTIVIDERTRKTTDYESNRESNGKIQSHSQVFFDRILSLSASHPKKTLILGLHTQKNDGQYNSVLVIEGGNIVSLYNKEHLLPFTERSFGFLKDIHVEPLSSGKNRGYGEGGEDKNQARDLNYGLPSILHTQYGDFAPLICSEALISLGKIGEMHRMDEMSETKESTPLINISNDNIFDSPRVAEYNKIIVRMRAIESGVSLIRVSKGGFSGIFDNTGREVAQNGSF